ncbi:hypothetical protein [Methanosarcina sp.]|uniref:hypothetical protein n=1 Tax=Methanosarcina sp. TaxID=2213 RepID=UPI003C74DE82
MTISKIVSALSSSEIVLELKVLKAIVEPPVQTLKARATLKMATYWRLVRVWAPISDDILITCKKRMQ